MVKLTPILLVEEIEPCLSFWVDRLGFELTVQVPDGQAVGFAMLKRGSVELMYQTRSSLKRDLPLLSEQSFHSATVLYIQVEDLDHVLERLSEYEVLVPQRDTSFGAREIFVREPGGSVVAFTQHLGLPEPVR